MKADAGTRRLAVAVPVANLRRKPADAPLMNVHDDLQETQLLFNELLLLRDEREDWFRVEAIEQPKSHGAGAWTGYPGWVRKRDVAEVESSGGIQRARAERFYHRYGGPVPTAPRLFPLSLATRLILKGEARKGFFEITLPHRSAGWVPKKDVVRRGRVECAGLGTGQEISPAPRAFSWACPTSGVGAACLCRGPADPSWVLTARAS